MTHAASVGRLPATLPLTRPAVESGRGLLLVGVLAARWGARPRRPLGKRLWAELSPVNAAGLQAPELRRRGPERLAGNAGVVGATPCSLALQPTLPSLSGVVSRTAYPSRPDVHAPPLYSHRGRSQPGGGHTCDAPDRCSRSFC
ncbi:hypothetical protein B9W62_17965 [Streptomyces sp. CS113]|nr:hypothetical protein B9W62_17965 [Streptomyces sp. CS113]